MNACLLEREIFSKPYFDRRGLIVACDGDELIGFVHAGFGADDQRATISTEYGATHALMVASHVDRSLVSKMLLAESERYLKERGARFAFGGGVFPVDGFYLGLLGGSRLSGTLLSNFQMLKVYRSAGYFEIVERRVLQSRLPNFRPIVNRDQLQVRRTHQVDQQLDPPTDNWWDACTLGMIQRTLWCLNSRHNSVSEARVLTWDMEPIASSWGVHAVGIMQLEDGQDGSLSEEETFLIGEILRQERSRGATLAEVHVAATDVERLEMFARLGFEEVDRSVTFRKEL